MIKFAIVGLGHIGSRHFETLKKNPECSVVALVDIDEQLLADFQCDGEVSRFTSLDQLLHSDLHFDVVCIATPNGLHCQQALQVLDSAKHVVIEKPMGLTKEECEKVVYKSLQVSKQVFVVKQNRYSPPSKWLKSLVKEGVLGDIYAVQINCLWNRDNRYYKPGSWRGTKELDGGVLFTQFSHFIDILYWVFGDVKNIRTQLHNFNHQENTEFADSGIAHFEFVNGGMGAINFSTSVWDANMESSISVIAENGSLKIGGQYMNEVVYCHIKNYSFEELEPTNLPNDYGQFKGSASNHQYVFKNVVDTLHGADTITANALEGMKVVDIIERIYKAGQ